MKLLIITFVILTSAVLVGCGVKTSPETSHLRSDSDGISSVGKGSKIVLTRDFEIPANNKQPVIGEMQYDTDDGYARRYLEFYKVCVFSMTESTLENRVIKAGTVIEFSGVASKEPDPNNKFEYDFLGISIPSAIDGIVCNALVRNCNAYTGACPEFEQDQFKISAFRTLLSKIGNLEIAPPVVIGGN